MAASNRLNRRTIATLVVVCMLLIGGIGWAMHAYYPREAVTAEPNRPDVSVAGLKELNPRGWMELFSRDDLTEEERTTLEENAQQAQVERLDEVVEGYFAAQTEEGQERYLDEQIDEWLRMREEMEQWQEVNPEKWEEMRERWRERMSRMPTRQERKEQFESGTMEKRARMFKYFMAARQRAEARGIDMSWGPQGDRNMDGGGDTGDEDGNADRRHRRSRPGGEGE
jgi:hypothetical protein